MDQYQDFFSQAASSSTATRSFHASPNASNEDDFGLFSPPVAPTLSAPQMRMEYLDLNSQADGFPNLGSYLEYLQAMMLPATMGYRPLPLEAEWETVEVSTRGPQTLERDPAEAEWEAVGEPCLPVEVEGEAVGDRWYTAEAVVPLLPATPSFLQSNLAPSRIYIKYASWE
ncbi:hypothetical protein SEVIR_2G106650v4 [Setaria viridis]